MRENCITSVIYGLVDIKQGAGGGGGLEGVLVVVKGGGGGLDGFKRGL